MGGKSFQLKLEKVKIFHIYTTVHHDKQPGMRKKTKKKTTLLP